MKICQFCNEILPNLGISCNKCRAFFYYDSYRQYHFYYPSIGRAIYVIDFLSDVNKIIITELSTNLKLFELPRDYDLTPFNFEKQLEILKFYS